MADGGCFGAVHSYIPVHRCPEGRLQGRGGLGSGGVAAGLCATWHGGGSSSSAAGMGASLRLFRGHSLQTRLQSPSTSAASWTSAITG